jgi:hypothetical protein
MDCSVCKDLDRVFESRLAEYREARSAAFYRVSTEIAAKREVDMERAKIAQQEHQLVCPSARKFDPEGQTPPDEVPDSSSCATGERTLGSN